MGSLFARSVQARKGHRRFTWLKVCWRHFIWVGSESGRDITELGFHKQDERAPYTVSAQRPISETALLCPVLVHKTQAVAPRAGPELRQVPLSVKHSDLS